MQATLSRNQFQRRAIWLIVAVLVLRVAYAFFLPGNLVGDEAYYWHWGQSPALGYFSKPPFIAWLYAAIDALAPSSVFAIRVASALLGAGSLFFLFFLTQDLFDARTGWCATLIAVCAPAITLLSFVLTIDAPLVFFWSAALFLTWRITQGQARWGDWVCLFFVLALGHLTKQMMLVFPVLVVAYVASVQAKRHFLTQSRFWLVLLGSYTSLAAPLIWNARNDWITFEHSAHHFDVEDQPSLSALLAERAETFVTFFASQVGMLSPVFGVALFFVVWNALFRYRRLPAQVRFCVIFSAVPLLGIALLALRQEINANWPAVFYVSGFALLAAWYTGNFTCTWLSEKLRGLFRYGVIGGIALSGFLLFGHLVFDAMGKRGHKADPMRRFYGHSELALAVNRTVSERTTEGESPAFLAVLGHRDLASFLAFGADHEVPIFLWDASPVLDSQYEVWPNPVESGFTGEDGLIIAPFEGISPMFKGAFGSVEKVGEFFVDYRWDRQQKFHVFAASGLRDWPKQPKAASSAQ